MSSSRRLGDRRCESALRHAAGALDSCTSTSSAPASSPSSCGRRSRPSAWRASTRDSWRRPRGRHRTRRRRSSRKLARTVTTMRRAHPKVVCEGMGISLPGRVDSTGRLVFAPNLRWGDADLASLIEGADRPAGRARERRERVRAGRAVVRPAPREHPAPPCGDRIGGHRRRPARERAAPARRRMRWQVSSVT